MQLVRAPEGLKFYNPSTSNHRTVTLIGLIDVQFSDDARTVSKLRICLLWLRLHTKVDLTDPSSHEKKYCHGL